MVRQVKKLPIGPSKLTQVLTGLNESPKLSLNSLTSLRVSYAFRNDHFGARQVYPLFFSYPSHFVNDHLPRIRWANPNLDIQIERVRKTPQEAWRPELEVGFANGTVRRVDMHQKWSTSILKELMDMAGGDAWKEWKVKARASGQPIVPGEENEGLAIKQSSSGVLPTLKVFRAAQQSRPTENSSKQSSPIPNPPPPSSPSESIAEATPS
ncbi:hypothetical protein AMATHDRAFT_150434 [Amanita thiersii Skay4041]|uniref:Ribosomal protein/NADH dehydrogenase domain-containing protein n=1 Tax=Amanita thiersii Skay4041 TaxID=703135 RepID=A0A2A9NKL1_9AGAR|nr:hypothetical protein AMATHDRAFT_150434 [Amanita thiersii Skay4041]